MPDRAHCAILLGPWILGCSRYGRIGIGVCPLTRECWPLLKLHRHSIGTSASAILLHCGVLQRSAALASVSLASGATSYKHIATTLKLARFLPQSIEKVSIAEQCLNQSMSSLYLYSIRCLQQRRIHMHACT